MNDYTTEWQYRQEKTAIAKGAMFQPDCIHAVNTVYTFYEHTHRFYSVSPVKHSGNTRHEVTKPPRHEGFKMLAPSWFFVFDVNCMVSLRGDYFWHAFCSIVVPNHHI